MIRFELVHREWPRRTIDGCGNCESDPSQVQGVGRHRQRVGARVCRLEYIYIYIYIITGGEIQSDLTF
jgi:hypothetical protein